MTKWRISRERTKRGWEIVNFTGPNVAESRGIVDFVAIRKDHREGDVERGDYFEIILIQVKGGSARWPTLVDLRRLRAVKRRYRAKDVVLAAWQRGTQPQFYKLGMRRLAETPKSAWGEPLSSLATVFD